MTKIELLEKHPDLVKEIVLEIFDLWRSGTLSSPPLEKVLEVYFLQSKVDYQILSFRTKVVGFLFTLDESDGFYKNSQKSVSYQLNTLLKPSPNTTVGMEINSVKRLSDNKIFTIGDRVEGFCKGGIIKMIVRSSTNKSQIQLFGNNFIASVLSSAIKLEPNFVTEDNKNIYYKDIFYLVHKENLSLEEHTSHRNEVKNPDYLYFKDKTNAEQHIVENKPSLSLAEVQNIPQTSINLKEAQRLVRESVKLRK